MPVNRTRIQTRKILDLQRQKKGLVVEGEELEVLQITGEQPMAQLVVSPGAVQGTTRIRIMPGQENQEGGSIQSFQQEMNGRHGPRGLALGIGRMEYQAAAGVMGVL
jgi:hypothetical protein